MNVPQDTVAEEEVVGIALASHAGRLSVWAVEPEHIYDLTLRRLFEACPALEPLAWDGTAEGELTDDLRAREAARVCDVAERLPLALVHSRSWWTDTGGHFGTRLRKAHRARRAMTVMVSTYEALGTGADPDEVLGELGSL